MALTGACIGAVSLRCLDLAGTARFFERALDCRASGDGALMLGRERIELQAATKRASKPAASNSTAFQHCAVIVADMEEALRRLDGVPGWSAISRAGPERLPATSGGAAAFKFRDPEGHPLEFLQFPSDATPPRWRHQPAGSLFLGIDHTAITVRDTAASIAFYEGLGFKADRTQLNHGIEQARLDDVDGAEVEVTSLRCEADEAPHIELLCYRRPGATSFEVPDDSVLATVTKLGSTGDEQLRLDPDGHRLLVRP